jgi:hypothetical protein
MADSTWINAGHVKKIAFATPKQTKKDIAIQKSN